MLHIAHRIKEQPLSFQDFCLEIGEKRLPGEIVIVVAMTLEINTKAYLFNILSTM